MDTLVPANVALMLLLITRDRQFRARSLRISSSRRRRQFAEIARRGEAIARMIRWEDRAPRGRQAGSGIHRGSAEFRLRSSASRLPSAPGPRCSERRRRATSPAVVYSATRTCEPRRTDLGGHVERQIVLAEAEALPWIFERIAEGYGDRRTAHAANEAGLPAPSRGGRTKTERAVAGGSPSTVRNQWHGVIPSACRRVGYPARWRSEESPRIFGSRRSRSPSPNRLSPRMVSMIAAPG